MRAEHAALNATVRLAGPEDRERIVGLVCAFRDHFHQRELSDADVSSSVERLLSDSATDFLLAVSAEGDVVGYAQLRHQYSLWVSGLLTQIEDLFVSPAFRRRGAGLLLLEASAARARQQSARFIWLNTNERNLDAMRLYTAAGFSSAREQWQGGRQLWLERDLREKSDVAGA
jgi:ribosomal protein S18 acetylase RimI-like enzyme